MLFGLLGLMFCGIPAMFVASKKGFADGRWLFAMGLIGLVIVSCLPSASSRGISHRTAMERRGKANAMGTLLCGINIFGCVAYAFIRSFAENAMRH
jgi:hypothetical protein